MDISTITVKQGRRAIDSAKVRELANSMNEIGLINPITVTPDKVLITGAHRLEAARLLGWTDIDATEVELDDLLERLHEIDENLMRNELHYLDVGNAYRRRDELLTAYGLRRKVGRYSNSAESAPLKTTAEIAKDLGVSERTMLVDKQIATNILPEVQDAINSEYVKSGILRDDNSWLYLIGDYLTIYIFAVNFLVAMYKTGKYRDTVTPTSKGFLIPLGDANKYAAKVIDIKNTA